MGWLTVKALQLDHAEALARSQAEQEERISLALWRMDTLLTPLLAQEAARPYFVYRPAFIVSTQSTKQHAEPQASPLLVQPSEFVLLTFQVASDGTVSSPQFPDESWRSFAIANGNTIANMGCSGELLDELGNTLDRQIVLNMLPEETLAPIVGIASPNDQANSGLPVAPDRYSLRNSDLPQSSQVVANAYAQQPAANPESQKDLGRRFQAFDNYAQREVVQQRLAPPVTSDGRKVVREGISRPIWYDGKLMLARRVNNEDEVLIQGCWLDWNQIHGALMQEVADLLPKAKLEPIVGPVSVDEGRMLATLPVRLIAGPPEVSAAHISPMQIALIVAWACLLLAVLAVAVLLMGVVSLSERRASFVSAVTHELRTPLTTFRMYAEMLADRMIPDEGRRQEYLNTLRGEADRLYHLVENVLAYSRLERGRPVGQIETVKLDHLIDRVQGRLADRAEAASMELLVELDDRSSNLEIHTDPAVVEQILLNLVDNACKYAAEARDRRIHLRTMWSGNRVHLSVTDHGPGISSGDRRLLFRAFSKSAEKAAVSAPGVGLGLALSRRLARQLGGTLYLDESPVEGAQFVLSLPT